MEQNTNNVALGRAGEKLAEEYLSQNGYLILARRYRTVSGEIDLVAELGEILAFVEVKTRRSTRFGLPGEAVTKRKQRAIIAAAQHYLAENELTDRAVRFDVIEVYARDHRICHIADAFLFSENALPML
jgi:putative endonuclease